MKVAKAYDDFDLLSVATGLLCEDKSLAIQSSRDEVDINTIVKRFGLTGQLPQEVAMPRYEDFEAVFDYHTAMSMVVESRQAFMRFPGDIRARFGHDPAQMIAFMENPDNLEEARKLGLAMPAPKVDTPVAVAPAGARVDPPGGS